MPRIAESTESLVGKVCSCSLGRAGLVTKQEEVTFGNGVKAQCWTGIGFDGNGLWATSQKQIIVLAECIDDYVEQVKKRPNNVLYGKIAVQLKG